MKRTVIYKKVRFALEAEELPLTQPSDCGRSGLMMRMVSGCYIGRHSEGRLALGAILLVRALL